VGIGEPQGFARERGDQLIEPVDARRVRHRRKYPKRDVSCGLHARAVLELLARNRRPHLGPEIGKGAIDIGHGRTTNLDAGVAPGLASAAAVAGPLRAHAKPAYETDLTVDREHLAMIPGEPAEGPAESGRI